MKLEDIYFLIILGYSAKRKEWTNIDIHYFNCPFCDYNLNYILTEEDKQANDWEIVKLKYE